MNALIEGAGSLAFVLGPALGRHRRVGDLARRRLLRRRALHDDRRAARARRVHTAGRRTTTKQQRARESRRGPEDLLRPAGVRYYVLMGTVVWFGFGAFWALEPLFYRDVVGTGHREDRLDELGVRPGHRRAARCCSRKLPRKAISARGLAIGAALHGRGRDALRGHGRPAGDRAGRGVLGRW